MPEIARILSAGSVRSRCVYASMMRCQDREISYLFGTEPLYFVFEDKHNIVCISLIRLVYNIEKAVEGTAYCDSINVSGLFDCAASGQPPSLIL
jgi:hypothetical protein